jgi:hypothetical protein
MGEADDKVLVDSLVVDACEAVARGASWSAINSACKGHPALGPISRRRAPLLMAA